MSWKDLVCLCLVIMGIVLFLYGANYYGALIGWTGLCLVIGGVLVKVVLMVWESLSRLKKKEDG